MNLEPIRELIALAATLRDQIDGGDGAYPDESFEVCNRTLDSIPALSQLLEAVTWIKCSERMPEPDTACLVVVPGGYIQWTVLSGPAHNGILTQMMTNHLKRLNQHLPIGCPFPHLPRTQNEYP